MSHTIQIRKLPCHTMRADNFSTLRKYMFIFKRNRVFPKLQLNKFVKLVKLVKNLITDQNFEGI